MKFTAISLMAFLLSLGSCAKENTQSKDYEGKWKLEFSSGGLSGGGFAHNFDFLVIGSDDKFEIIDGNNLITSGILDIKTDVTFDYKVDFSDGAKASNDYIDLVDDPEKCMNVSNDTLFIYSPCCDRYDSVYLRS